MCFDPIDPFNRQVSPVVIGQPQVQMSQDSFDWRLFTCVSRSLLFVAATFSGIAFFTTGEPLALVLNLILGFLTFKFLTDDDWSFSNRQTSPHPYHINTLTQPLFYTSGGSSHHTTRIIRHHNPTTVSVPLLDFAPTIPFQLPFGNSFSDHADVGRESRDSQPSFSTMSFSTPVGRNPSNNFYVDNYTDFPHIQVVQQGTSDHAPVGRESNTTRSYISDDSNDHAQIGRRDHEQT